MLAPEATKAEEMVAQHMLQETVRGGDLTFCKGSCSQGLVWSKLRSQSRHCGHSEPCPSPKPS